MDAYASWMRCVSDASGVVPQIALITGVCAGSAAVTASMFDLIVTVKDKAQLYMTTPFVLGEETATAEAAAKSGLSALTCESEAEALGAVRALIGLLPSNNCDHAVADAEDPNRALFAGAELPAAMLDGGVMMELYAEFAPEMTTALGRMGGEIVGVVAAKGALTIDAARKAARMVSLCDAFHIPVVTLVDSEGVEVDAVAQAMPASAVYARLATAYASSTCAKITVVTGKAYGAAYTLLGSRSLGADLVLALPEAVISTMAPEKAVAFVWNDKVTEENTREMVEKEWIDTYAKPEIAAMRGDIDDVIPVEELRMRVCSALYMLASKADGKPVRRHPTLAL
jgi:acetyl-CoA carboxylase carboxyltransferase component